MRKILLTGGAGYIGSHIAVCAREAGHDFVLFDNFSNSHPSVINNLEKIIGDVAPIVEGDIRDADLLSDLIKDHQITDVIHLAGLKSVEESVEKPDLYYENNVEGTKSLLVAMEKRNIFRLAFSSSATVYGEPEYLPLDESHPIRTVNPYAESKVLVERLLKEKCVKDERWQVVNLRYFNPVGSHESGFLGDNAKALRANLMPMIARVLTGKRDYLEIYGNDYDTKDGTCMRDYIHIMDLAEGHVRTLNYLGNAKGCTAINLGTGKGVSVMELVKTFEQIIDGEIPLKYVPRRAGDVPVCYANCDKAKELLGWQARRSLEEMCESTLNWCKRIDS
jgi:UDP-glucose 4-epimerase